MYIKRKLNAMLMALPLLFIGQTADVSACTGMRITAEDGSAIYGRTMEWGTFNLNSRVALVPKNYTFTGSTPDGVNGKKWKSKYGFISLDIFHENVFSDGMNEKGLAAGLFYQPGFASYNEYDKKERANSMSYTDLVPFILSQFSTVAEVKDAVKAIKVVATVNPQLGAVAQIHWMVTEPSGKSIVIEYTDHVLKIYDAPLSVITNSPTYDWHMINLRNYINLSAVAIPTKKLNDTNFSPLGVGSGMMGLPGDFTPPSRFIRAVAWSQTHRPLRNSTEGVYELFRILDNFNVPLTAVEGKESMQKKVQDMRSGTQWTTAWDLSKRVLYFHTQNDRRVRKVDMNRIDFSKKEIVHIPLDEKQGQDIKDLTPSK